MCSRLDGWIHKQATLKTYAFLLAKNEECTTKHVCIYKAERKIPLIPRFPSHKQRKSMNGFVHHRSNGKKLVQTGRQWSLLASNNPSPSHQFLSPPPQPQVTFQRTSAPENPFVFCDNSSRSTSSAAGTFAKDIRRISRRDGVSGGGT